MSVLLPGAVATAQTAAYGNDGFGSGKYGGASATPSIVSPSPISGEGSATELLDSQSTTSPAATSSLNIATTTESINIGTTTINASATSSLPFTKNLGMGMKNEDVKILQEFLSRYSDLYPNKYITGYFGSTTKEAIIKFQARYNLPQTGFVGPLTIRKLNELAKTAPEPEPKPIEKIAKSPEELENEIRVLQNELLKIIKSKVGEIKSAVELLLNRKL